MSIVLFMMFLFSGLMITLICRFTVFSEYEYTQGMYLGVHIPPEEKGSEIVRPFMEKEVKRQKIFQNINMLLSVLLCIPVLFLGSCVGYNMDGMDVYIYDRIHVHS